MSVERALHDLQNRIANAYTVIGTKGGTLPSVQDTANLSTAIDTIPTGGGSAKKWGMTLDEIAYVNDAGQLKHFGGLSGSTVNFTGVRSVSPATFYDAFRNNATIQSASFPDLSVVNSLYSFHGAFYGCSNFVSASFPKLISAFGDYVFEEAFMNCTSLGEISFPELSAVGSGNSKNAFTKAFQGCTSLSSISFPKLLKCDGSTATGFVFQGVFDSCPSLSTISFPELSSIYGVSYFITAFRNCTKLTTVSFPKLKEAGGNSIFNQAFTGTQVTTLSFPELSTLYNTGSSAANATFKDNPTLTALYFPKLIGMSTNTTKTNVTATHLFDGCKNLVEIHFGSANQTIIEGSSGYATKWGAPNANCQIYFDL